MATTGATTGAITGAITGATRVYLMLADPIAQVRTPEVLNAWCAAKGIDAVMVALQVAAPDLQAVWAGLRAMRNLDGLVISVPHKAAVARLADELLANARQIGTANAVRRAPDGRMVAENFDGQGFVTGLLRHGHEPGGRRILLVGCGGAGAAIAHSLAAAGAAALTLVDLDRARAVLLAERVTAHHPACRVTPGDADPAGHDMVVNATPLGMAPDDPLPVDASRLAPSTTVAEVIMKPALTPLLVRAQAIGCPIHAGRHMLDHQWPLLTRFFGLAR